MKSEDELIAKYRADLTAEADIARGDLDEIEDHLRTLTHELRERGLPHVEAVTEACRRLGEPKQVAREVARVRTPFGARLSRGRSWSAAILLVPAVLEAARNAASFGLVSPAGIELGLVALVFAALVSRLTWARPIIIGSLLVAAAWGIAIMVGTGADPALGKLVVGCQLGALVFLVPWKRGELTESAIGLGFLAPAYMAAAMSLVYRSGHDGHTFINPISAIAFAAVISTGAAFLLRARWGAITGGLAMLALAGTLHGMTFRLGVASSLFFGFTALGMIAAGVSAVVCWRTTRSLGTLRYILS